MEKLDGVINALLEAVALSVYSTGNTQQIENFARVTRDMAFKYEAEIREPMLLIVGRVEELARLLKSEAPEPAPHSTSHPRE